jgi:hypothetical protein
MCLGEPDCQGEASQVIATSMGDEEKKARLAQALRENLRKRKAQSRAQAEPTEAPESPKPKA